MITGPRRRPATRAAGSHGRQQLTLPPYLDATTVATDDGSLLVPGERARAAGSRGKRRRSGSDCQPASARVSSDTVVAGVAVVAQQQSLSTKLDALGLPGPLGVARCPSALPFQRAHPPLTRVDDVQPCDQREAWTRQRHGARHPSNVVVFPRCWRTASGLFCVPVHEAAVDRVVVVNEAGRTHSRKVTAQGVPRTLGGAM